MTRRMHITPAFAVAPLALILGTATPIGFAEDEDEVVIPFDEAHIFFELNNTDGDLGIHGKFDGQAWRRLIVEDPKERTIFECKEQRTSGKAGNDRTLFRECRTIV